MIKNNKKVYECYSYKQKNYLLSLDFQFEYSDTHNVTNRKFWVFEVTSELEVALKAWTYHRNKIAV